MFKEKELRSPKILIVVVLLLFTLYSLVMSFKNKPLNLVSESKNFLSNEKFMYLSDIPYITEQSNVGWGQIRIDENVDGSDLISLIVDGKRRYFLKGIGAHATSNVVFDVSNYDYDYFSTYYGVDASRGTLSDGVKFAIYTSVDGKNWDLHTLVSPPVKKGNTEAEFLNIDIRGKNYIKLYCLQYGSATADHCVYGDAKLYKEGYVEEGNKTFDFIKPVLEYDDILKNLSLEEQLNKELLLLQREFVNRVGYDLLQNIANLDSDYEDVLRWLMTDLDNLRLYINGGYPSGSYMNSIKVLSVLYKNYKDDFNINTISKYGNNVGDLYKRMAITLSLTHSAKVALWMQPSEPTNQSDAVTRYAIFKKLYDEGKFVVNDSIDISKWFESYTIEEMRFVMNNIIDDESILWLNEYTQSQIDAHPDRVWSYLTPHPYMAYVWPNYGNPVFHDLSKKDYWDKLYNGIFSKYGVTYSSEGKKVYKVWMNFRNEFGTGAVCGGISKTGSNIRTVHGIPASVIGQPGHAAIIYYTQNSSGEGYWGIDNDVSGWTRSEKGERMLLGWGNDTRYVRGYNVPYIVMAQEAINRFDKYQKSAEILMLSDIYKSNSRKREEYLWASLEELDFNVDVWYSLIMLFNNDTSKTEDDYYVLASKMSESLLEFPTAYYNLMELISPHMVSSEAKFKYTLLLKDTLMKAKNYNGSDVLQPSITRTLANYFLGQVDTTLATFSFDGENAGKIVLSSRFDNSGIRWDYSLDGKNNWKEVSFTANEEHKYKLSQEEINSINAENDIYIHIVGAPYNDENILKIDILENTILEKDFFRNDLENRIMGINLTYEWRNNDSDSWTSYAVKSPDNTGNKTLQIRQAPSGVKLASNVLTFNFTEDTDSETRKYIPVSHLSIHAVSTEAVNNGGSAVNAIDGNYNTRWHSAWNGTDTERYIIVKLDQPVVLSAVEFVPAGGGNGKIYDGTIYGSLDGEKWEVLASEKDLRYTNQANTNEDAILNTKSFEIDNPRQVQYVKIVADRTNGNWFTARAFNFYQDITNNSELTVGLAYSTTELTNQNVLVRLMNTGSNINILNNNGNDTYIFTSNGEFTFIYEDAITKVRGSAKATVNNIDKTPPTAEIIYSSQDVTTGEVVAKLVNPSEEIEILNNKDNENTDVYIYTFDKNGEFTFEFRDKAGNIGYATAKVNWIKDAIDLMGAKITYDINSLTNKNVTATISFEKNDVTISNNGGSNDYTFTENGEFTFWYVDEEGNTGNITAKVNWIDKVNPTAKVAYSIMSDTNNPVVVSLVNESEDIIVINNGGRKSYTFTENGEFTFEFKDKAGNIGYATAKVDYIKEELISRISYDINTWTNKDVEATITFDKSDVIVTNNNGSNKYIFTENGEFTFEFKDSSGKTGTMKASVNYIDKIPPVAKVIYSINTNTYESVVATLVNESEEIFVINNGGSKSFVFKSNGEFTFEFRDKAGNIGKVIASVNWIKKSQNNSINNSDNNNQNNNTEVIPPENNTKVNNYSSGRFSIEINEDLGEDVIFKSEVLELTSKVKEKFGSSSEFFELYFMNEEEKLNLSFQENAKITISLDKNKELNNVYFVNEDLSFEKISYKDLNNHKIEIETDKVGKYVIDYKEVKQKLEKEDKSSSAIIWYIGGGLLILVIIGAIVSNRKKEINI